VPPPGAPIRCPPSSWSSPSPLPRPLRETRASKKKTERRRVRKEGMEEQERGTRRRGESQPGGQVGIGSMGARSCGAHRYGTEKESANMSPSDSPLRIRGFPPLFASANTR